MLGQLIQTKKFIFRELLIIKLFTGYHIGNSQKKGHIRSGPYRIPLICQGSGFCVARIKYHDPAAVFSCCHQVYGIRCYQGLERVGS